MFTHEFVARVQREVPDPFGLGGVGLSALLAALDAEAAPVIAVDTQPEKLALARSLGATSAVHPDELLELVTTLPSLGADHVLECIGIAATAELALRAVRPGGAVTLVGMTEQGVTAGVDVYRFVEDGVRLLGSNYGSCIPARDFPRIATDVLEGRLPLARIIAGTVRLDEVDAAFESMRRRDGARRIVVFD